MSQFEIKTTRSTKYSISPDAVGAEVFASVGVVSALAGWKQAPRKNIYITKSSKW